MKTTMLALACSAGLALSAAAQQTANQAAQPSKQPAQQTQAAGTSGSAKTGAVTNTPAEFGTIHSAPVPQYWISDADIFIGNAAHTAAVLAGEGRFSVQSPQIVGDQASMMVNAINRAIQDMQSLNSNAQQSNSQALGSIQNTIAHLQAALAQAKQAVQTAQSSNVGPTYQVAMQSALRHLGSAANSLAQVGSDYQNTNVISARMFGAGGTYAGGSNTMGGANRSNQNAGGNTRTGRNRR